MGKIKITDKEKEILIHISDGTPDKEIANILNRSIATVRLHVMRLFAKSGCDNSVSLITWAFRNGVIK